MRRLFTDLLTALLAVSGLMSPNVMAGDDIQCDSVVINKLLNSATVNNSATPSPSQVLLL